MPKKHLQTQNFPLALQYLVSAYYGLGALLTPKYHLI